MINECASCENKHLPDEIYCQKCLDIKNGEKDTTPEPEADIIILD